MANGLTQKVFRGMGDDVGRIATRDLGSAASHASQTAVKDITGAESRLLDDQIAAFNAAGGLSGKDALPKGSRWRDAYDRLKALLATKKGKAIAAASALSIAGAGGALAYMRAAAEQEDNSGMRSAVEAAEKLATNGKPLPVPGAFEQSSANDHISAVLVCNEIMTQAESLVGGAHVMRAIVNYLAQPDLLRKQVEDLRKSGFLRPLIVRKK